MRKISEFGGYILISLVGFLIFSCGLYFEIKMNILNYNIVSNTLITIALFLYLILFVILIDRYRFYMHLEGSYKMPISIRKDYINFIKDSYLNKLIYITLILILGYVLNSFLNYQGISDGSLTINFTVVILIAICRFSFISVVFTMIFTNIFVIYPEYIQKVSNKYLYNPQDLKDVYNKYKSLDKEEFLESLNDTERYVFNYFVCYFFSITSKELGLYDEYKKLISSNIVNTFYKPIYKDTTELDKYLNSRFTKSTESFYSLFEELSKDASKQEPSTIRKYIIDITNN